MSATLLLAKERFASDVASSTCVDIPRPPPLALGTSIGMPPDLEDGLLSCARTAMVVTRFLKTPLRRSCSFVNVDSVTLAELGRAAQSLSLVLSQSSEENIGSVVRLSRQPSCLDEPYPIDSRATPPSPFKRASSFNSEVMLREARRVVSGSLERPRLTEDGTGGVYMIRESSREASERMSERSSDGGDETPPRTPRTPAPMNTVFTPTGQAPHLPSFMLPLCTA